MIEWLCKYSEFFGFIATSLVLVSFLMRGERKIRIINLISALVFIIYGVLIAAKALWIMNILLVIIHAYRLYVIEKQAKYLKSKIATFYTHDNKYIQKINNELRRN